MMFKLENGDHQFGDFKYRKNKNWLHLVWYVLYLCNLKCPYCVVGQKKQRKDAEVTLVDKFGLKAVLGGFKKIRDDYGKNLYVTLTGGEPTIAKQFPKIITSFQKSGIAIELQTNFVSTKVENFLNAADPSLVSQITASFHGYLLDKNEKMYNRYVSHFCTATEMGFSPLVKIVATPEEIKHLPQKVEKLKNDLPEGAPILIWNYINGQPKSPTEPDGAYPYAYTKKEERTLKQLNDYRIYEQQAYRDGAGFFKGMKCGAGTDFAFICQNGDVYRCWPYRCKRSKDCLGNIMKKNVKLSKKPQVCKVNYCGTTFWPLWYGVNPWEYIPGWNKEKCCFCRYGPNCKEE